MKKLLVEAPDKVVVADVPMPEMGPEDVLIRSVRSLISPGSELNRVRRLPGDEDANGPITIWGTPWRASSSRWGLR